MASETGHFSDARLESNLKWLMSRQPELVESIRRSENREPIRGPELRLDPIPHPVMVFLFGAGNGDLLTAIGSMPSGFRRNLILFERSISNLRYALGCISLQEIQQGLRGNIRIISLDHPTAIRNALYEYFKRPPALFLLSSVQYVEDPHLSEDERQFYRAIIPVFEEGTVPDVLQRLSVPREHIERGFENFLNFINQGRIPPLPPSFAGIAAGRPAVLISAGPSLDYNLDLLKESRDRVITIAADICLKACLRAGFEPTFVTAVDRASWVSEFLNAETKNTWLLAAPHIDPGIFERFPDRTILAVPNDGLYRWVFSEEDTFELGATVADLGFQWALHIGAEPIVLIGQDCAIDPVRRKVYASKITDTFEPGFEFSTHDAVSFEKNMVSFSRFGGGVRREIGNLGDEVIIGEYENDRVFFEQVIARSKRHVINCTHGGAVIRGVQWHELGQMIAQWRALDGVDFSPVLSRAGSTGQFRKIRESAEKLREGLEEIRTICAEIIMLVSDSGAAAITEVLRLRDRLIQSPVFRSFVLAISISEFLVYQNQVNRIPKENLTTERQATEFVEKTRRIAEQLLRDSEWARDTLSKWLDSGGGIVKDLN